MSEDVLRTEGEFLRLNHAEQDRVNVQGVIGRPVVGLVLFDGTEGSRSRLVMRRRELRSTRR